jgi:hypothetical protein
MNLKIWGFSERPHLKSAMPLIVLLVAASTVPVLASSAKPRAQWTFMVYLDGDNNLDYYGYQNLEAMESVGSTNGVNIIVLWDRYDDFANLYKVGLGGLTLVRGFSLNGEEANMGDPETLRNFVSFTTQKFKADNYALVLWDHGDDHRGCCWDDHPDDYLSHQEITWALDGFHLNIVAFDACVSGMIEIAYEYVWAGLEIDYLVATEGYVPYAGYPYTAFLGALAAAPDMNAYDFSTVIVDSYVSFYEDLRPASRLVELASIDLSCIGDIVDQLCCVTGFLTGWLETDRDTAHGIIGSAKGAGHLGWSEYGWEAYIDLPTFFQVLAENGVPGAADLYQMLGNAMYVSASHALSSAEGMGIFFPGSYSSFLNNEMWYGDYYLFMQFPHEGWWEFLQAYWGV